MIKVYCKLVTITAEDFKNSSKKIKKNDKEPLISIDDLRPEMRVGAFEVQLYRKVEGKEEKKILHSKLSTRRWPNINEVLTKIGIVLVVICS